MHLCTCSLQLACFLGALHYFFLHLPARPLSGLIGKLYPTPVNFTHLLLQLAPDNFFNKVCSPTPLIFPFSGFSDEPNMDKLLRTLCYVLWGSFDCFISLTYSEGSPNWSEELGCNFCAIWTWSSIPTFSAVSYIVARLLVSLTTLSLWHSCGIFLCPLVHFLKVEMIFLEGLIRHCKWRPGKYSSWILFLLSLDKEGIVGQCYLLSNRLSYMLPSFLLLCRGG